MGMSCLFNLILRSLYRFRTSRVRVDPRPCRKMWRGHADVGIRVVRIPPHCPRVNCFAERFVRPISAELTDRMLIFGQQHLRLVLRNYVRHYNGQRPHRARELHPRQPEPPGGGPQPGTDQMSPDSGRTDQLVRTNGIKSLLSVGSRLLEPRTHWSTACACEPLSGLHVMCRLPTSVCWSAEHADLIALSHPLVGNSSISRRAAHS